MKPLERNERSRCAPQAADRVFDLGEVGRAPAGGAGGGFGWLQPMLSSSAATGWPTASQSGEASSRARISACAAPERACVAQFGQAGTPQQRPQRGIAERGFVELAEVAVAAVIFQQDRIAHVI